MYKIKYMVKYMVTQRFHVIIFELLHCILRNFSTESCIGYLKMNMYIIGYLKMNM